MLLSGWAGKIYPLLKIYVIKNSDIFSHLIKHVKNSEIFSHFMEHVKKNQSWLLFKLNHNNI